MKKKRDEKSAELAAATCFLGCTCSSSDTDDYELDDELLEIPVGRHASAEVQQTFADELLADEKERSST